MNNNCDYDTPFILIKRGSEGGSTCTLYISVLQMAENIVIDLTESGSDSDDGSTFPVAKRRPASSCKFSYSVHVSA